MTTRWETTADAGRGARAELTKVDDRSVATVEGAAAAPTANAIGAMLSVGGE